MKKKVRIYKAPDGKGKFVNKTAKFLHKAQQGGQQNPQAQIADYVYKTLDDAEPFEFDTVKESLISELAAAKIPIEQAEDMVENIATNLQAQTAETEQLAGQGQDVYDQGLEDLKAQEEAAAAAEEERQAGLADDYGYYDDTAAQGEDDEDEEDYDDEEEASYMQAGGDIIPDDNPVSFVGYNPDQYTVDKQQSFAYGGMTKRKYVGKVMKLLKKAQEGQQTEDKEDGFDPTDTIDKKKTDLNKGFVNALANTAQEAKMKERAEAMWEQQQQMMQQQASQYPMQAPMEQVPMAQRGLSINHGGHIRQGLGDKDNPYIISGCFGKPGEDCGPEDLSTSSDNVGILPGQSDIVGLPRRGEPGYQEPRSGTPPYIGSSPNIYGSNPSLSPRQMRRMMPRGFGRNQMRSFAGMVPPGGFFPMGMNIMTYPMMMPEQKPIHVQGTIPGMKLDVRKSHWLTGRPSQYSIEFGGDGAIPGFNMMPGMGYGIKSTQRKTIEGVSKLVNKAADPAKNNKVELNNNPDPEKKNSADAAVANQANVVKDKEGNPIISDASNMMWNSSGTNMPTAENPGGKSSSTTSNNPNKDAVGKGAKVPTKTATNKTVTATKSKQVGQTKQATPTSISNKGKAAVTPVTQQSYADVIEEPASESFNFLTPIKRGFAEALKNYKPTPEAPTFHPRLGNYQQAGGFIDSSNPDLYKFVYGGDDIITQQDANYSDSKNTGSPFFAYGGHIKYKDKGEVKEDDYDKYLREKAEQEALDEYNAFMNRGEGDKNKMVKYKPNVNDAIYNKILGQSRKKYNIADPNEKPKVEEKKTEPKQEQEESAYQGSTYNPYSGYGGGYRPNAFGTYFPANTVRRLGTWTQQQGMPYDPRTGAGYFGGFGPNTQLSKIDVRKSGWLSGRPKKYTMYFNNPEMDPTKPQFSINTGTTEGKPGTTETGWGEEDLRTRKDRRQAKRYDRLMQQIKGQTAPEEAADEETATSDMSTLPASQMPTSISDMPIPAMLGSAESKAAQQYNTLYPAGTTSDSGISSIYEPEETVPNSYQAPGVTPENEEEYNTLYPEGTRSVTGIDEIYEPEATIPNSYIAPQQNAPVTNQDEEQIADEMSLSPEQQLQNKANMYRNPMFMGSNNQPSAVDEEPDFYNEQSDMSRFQVPGFGEGMMGAPMMNGAISPWSLPEGFNPDMPTLPLAGGLGAARPEMMQSPQPFMTRNDLFGEEYPLDPSLRNDYAQLQQLGPEQYYSNKISGINTGVEKREKAEQDAIIAKRNAAIAARQAALSGQSQAQPATTGMTPKEQTISNVSTSIGQSRDDLESLANSTRAGQIYTEMKKAARLNGINPDDNPSAFQKMLKGYGWDKFYKLYQARGRKQFGGNSDLGKFVYGDEVTQTSTGKASPIVYTNNPALEGIRDVDIVGPNTEGITNLQPSSFWSNQQSFNKPSMDFQTGCTEEQKKDPKSRCYDAQKYGMKVQEDALGSARETTKKTYTPQAGEFAVDFKNKNAYEVDAQGVLNTGNAAARGILNFFEKRGQRKRNKNFYDQFTSDNLYADDPSRDRGDYDVNTGLYRPNEQGQIWNSRSKQLGGFMQEGGFVEGDVVDMTPEELEEFIANGGEVEIIS